MDGYRFHSDLFEIESGEDDEINPRIYGRQLAEWLRAQLEHKGYAVEPVIAEDWGRCLVCSRDPFMLWVGCGSSPDYSTAQPGDPAPPGGQVEWHCFAMAEPSAFQRWFRRVDGSAARTELDRTLREILLAEPRIRLLGQHEHAP